MKKTKIKIIVVFLLIVLNVGLLFIYTNKMFEKITNKSNETPTVNNTETNTNDVNKKENNMIEINEIEKDNITNEQQNENIEPVSNTLNKSIVFFGDSIVQGFLTKGYSWATYISENYDFNSVKNAGIIDYRVSTYDDPKKWLVDEISAYSNNEYDYVILEGGVNDMIYATPLGKVSSSSNIEDFDVTTFSGGLEAYIATARKLWPNAKIGYIISYSVPKYQERGLSFSYEEYKKYVDIQKEVFSKWGIPYIDLSNDEFTKILEVETNKYLPDYLHLNKAGYELISPCIYNWINKLD